MVMLLIHVLHDAPELALPASAPRLALLLVLRTLRQHICPLAFRLAGPTTRIPLTVSVHRTLLRKAFV